MTHQKSFSINYFQLIILLLLAIPVFSIPSKAADGDLDSGFGTNGTINENYHGFTSRQHTVAVQPDGKIIVAGTSTLISNFTNDFTLVRYNVDGTADTSFGTNGILYADVGGKNDIVPTVLLQADGKIILVGHSKNSADRSIISIFRFNSDGTTDTSFGTNGVTLSAITTSGTRGDTPFDAILQPDGKIVVAGAWNGAPFCIARWNNNGSIDSNFGTDGNLCAITSPAGTGQMTSLALQTDGKIVASAKFTTSFTAPFDFMIFRFNQNGTLDTSFDGDGYARTDFDSVFDDAMSIHVLPDGKILATGRAGINGSSQYNFGLARYNSNGSLDSSFGTNGKAVAFADNTAGSEDYSSVLLENGKIIIARYKRQASPGISTDGQIARFNADGSIDSSFGNGGQITNSSLKEIWDIARQPDGKIIAVGWSQNSNAITARFLNTDSASTVSNPALRFADFDGDGKSDASVFRNGTWFINPSTGAGFAPNGFYAIEFGLPTDKLASADYDGDEKTDIAVWREDTQSYFYILQSSDNTVITKAFGQTGDKLTVGDYDGDGRADLSVYREGAQSFFYYLASSNNPNENITFIPFGTAGDKPVRGDFDGDGKFDVAVFRPNESNWYISLSADNSLKVVRWGLGSDKLVPADFDGDNKTDVAVFRNGVWYILQSNDNQPKYIQWGLTSDVLVPADFDGDGKSDAAVWREGIYYILSSLNSQMEIKYLGTNGDLPIASALQ